MKKGNNKGIKMKTVTMSMAEYDVFKKELYESRKRLKDLANGEDSVTMECLGEKIFVSTGNEETKKMLEEITEKNVRFIDKKNLQKANAALCTELSELEGDNFIQKTKLKQSESSAEEYRMLWLKWRKTAGARKKVIIASNVVSGIIISLLSKGVI